MLDVAPGWSVDVERGPDWLFVRLHAHTEAIFDAAGLADMLWQVLQQQLTHRLVLELDDLPILSSQLIGELVRLHKRIEQHDGLLRLVGLSERNLEALRLTRLDGSFPHYASREDAVMCHNGARPR